MLNKVANILLSNTDRNFVSRTAMQVRMDLDFVGRMMNSSNRLIVPFRAL